MAATGVETGRLAIDGGPKAITEAIPRVLNGPAEIGEAEERNVLDVLRRQTLFRFAVPLEESYVGRLEAGFAQKMGTKHALAVSSGTAALVTGLLGIGIEPGDEVIVPGYTYIASAAAILLCNAVPVIAEIDETLTIDPEDVERKITPYTRAIMPVHMRGIPCQMDRILEIARRHNLLVIEDVAQADGASFRGRRLGSLGNAGCFSLQYYKIITTGEGGMVITDDDRVYARAAMAHDSALGFWNRIETGDLEPIPGNGYRMSELAGAVGLAQLDRLDGIIDAMRARKRELLAEIAGAPGLTPAPSADPEGDAGLSLNLLFPDAGQARRFAEALAAEGAPVHTIYNQGIPDRHIYRHWEYVLNKTSLNRAGFPWRGGFYKGNVEYSPEMCPRTLDVLSRTVAVSINQRMTPAHMALVGAACRKVARAYYGG
jgi:8-amino-3,8-dideoxy-alpha-D-manno-octulosonate transaminase